VQRQLDAFNARDLDALLAAYADDAQLFEHPSKLLARGSAAFRERFTARFLERLKENCSQCGARIFGFWRGFGEGVPTCRDN
jgi:hypothetical protein